MTKRKMAEQIVATFKPSGVAYSSMIEAFVQGSSKTEVENHYRTTGVSYARRILKRLEENRDFTVKTLQERKQARNILEHAIVCAENGWTIDLEVALDVISRDHYNLRVWRKNNEQEENLPTK